MPRLENVSGYRLEQREYLGMTLVRNLVLKRSKVTQSKGISLPDDITIKMIKEVKG